jgi:hypothetical protein
MDPHTQKLQELIKQAEQLRKAANELLAGLTDQLNRSLAGHADQDQPVRERRTKPRP